MGEVVDFEVKPKTINRTYKQHKFTVTYTPATKKWHWEVEIVSTTKLTGNGDTQMKAVRAAERQIDQVLKVQGRDTG